MIRELEPRLHIILAWLHEGRPTELLASGSDGLFAAVVRITTLSCGIHPVLPVADALVLAGQVDTPLLVVRWERPPAPRHWVLSGCCRSRARIMGAVMTWSIAARRRCWAGACSMRSANTKGYHVAYRSVLMRNVGQHFRRCDHADGSWHPPAYRACRAEIDATSERCDAISVSANGRSLRQSMTGVQRFIRDCAGDRPPRRR